MIDSVKTNQLISNLTNAITERIEEFNQMKYYYQVSSKSKDPMISIEIPTSTPNSVPQDDTSNNKATVTTGQSNDLEIEELRINHQKILDYIKEMRKMMAKKWYPELTRIQKINCLLTMQNTKTLQKIADRQQRILQYAGRCKNRVSTKDFGGEVHTWGKSLRDLSAGENGPEIQTKIGK